METSRYYSLWSIITSVLIGKQKTKLLNNETNKFSGRREKHISFPSPLPYHEEATPNLCHFQSHQIPKFHSYNTMAVYSLANSIHFHIPNTFSNSTSNNLNATTSLSSCVPPALSVNRRGSLCVKCRGSAKPENKNHDENDPLETIDKLYKTIKKKDIVELSNVIADQHPHIFDSIPFLQTNLKMWNMVSNIIRGLQDSLVFSVQPTTKDGSMVGIKWRVGWHKPLIGSEKGVNIHSHHIYTGKLLIGNFEMLLDPLLQLGPTKMMKWNEESKSKEKRIASMCLGVFLLLVSLFCLQFSVR